MRVNGVGVMCLLQEKLPNMILLETSRGLLDSPAPILLQEKVGERRRNRKTNFQE